MTPNPPEATRRRIPLSDIQIPPERVTAQLADVAYAALRDDMAARGLRVPVDVVDVQGALWLADGFNRCTAAQELDWPDIEAFVRPGTMADVLLENLGANERRGHNRPGDLARLVAKLLQDHHLTLDEIQRRTGLSADYLRRLGGLAGLHPYIRAALDAGNLPVGVALELARLQDQDAQVRACVQAVNHQWTVKGAGELVDAILAELAKPPADRVPLENVQPLPEACGACLAPTSPALMTSLRVCAECAGVLLAALRAPHLPGVRGA